MSLGPAAVAGLSVICWAVRPQTSPQTGFLLPWGWPRAQPAHGLCPRLTWELWRAAPPSVMLQALHSSISWQEMGWGVALSLPRHPQPSRAPPCGLRHLLLRDKPVTSVFFATRTRGPFPSLRRSARHLRKQSLSPSSARRGVCIFGPGQTHVWRGQCCPVRPAWVETAGRDFESRDHFQEHFSISGKEKKPGGATPRTVAHAHVCTRDVWPSLSSHPLGRGEALQGCCCVECPWGRGAAVWSVRGAG